MEKIAKNIINFLKREFKKRNKTRAILAVSGGVDSAVCAFLCKKAGLDLYAVILPYGNQGREGLRLVRELNLPKNQVIFINIAPLVDRAVKELKGITKINHIDRGNIMARQRMIIQYALARSLNGLVVGTKNLSEYYLGYFTRHGDEAGDINPIGSLWKIQVYELAKYLGVPKWILKKKPSADFWPSQTDEKELGFSYKDADQILYLSLIKKYSPEKIIKKGFNPSIVNKVLERVKATEYKRQSPLQPLFK